MGLLIDGKWHDQWYDTDAHGGRFVRDDAHFRNWITPDGASGPSGVGGFKARAGRYHLYISLACPWAHRSLIFREIKRLHNFIDVSVVDYLMLENGWSFSEANTEGQQPRPTWAKGGMAESAWDATGDRLYHSHFLHEIYTRAAPAYYGRVTVPVLWDREQQTVVNNESSEIIRMFNSAFDHLGAASLDLYPREKQAEIDALNKRIYDDVNNGVYKAGFATTQAAYEQALTQLFSTLDWLELLLGEKRYLTGQEITEADWRLFTTLVRFDAVYVGHFKCNLKRLQDYPALSRYLAELYHQPGIAATVNMRHIKGHYYQSHKGINPSQVVPVGPALDFMAAPST